MNIGSTRRVVQISLDIIVDYECDGTELAKKVENVLKIKGYDVVGAGFQADVTEYYKENGGANND